MEEKPAPLKSARVRHPTGHVQKYFTDILLHTSGALTDITKEEGLERVTDGRKTLTLEMRKGAAPNCSPSEVLHGYFYFILPGCHLKTRHSEPYFWGFVLGGSMPKSQT